MSHIVRQREQLSIRHVASGDLKHVRHIFERTTSEDRYCRFFQFKDELDDAALLQFVDFGTGTVGLLAFDGATPVGMAHAWVDEFGAAELGVIVSGDVRRRGVGLMLIESLLDELRARAVQELFAYALGENAAFAALARRLGMTRQSVEDGVATFRLALA
ncbi:MAG: GNAT family N-acetyltransferase [Candidatus Eremiobacteraeota bacterium]|nr:GNAT family N-acetyltransferase [Candidatus Eremiobacteraeota bacterium]